MRLATSARRLARITGWCLLPLIVYAILHVLLVYFPQPIFRHHRTHKNFTVYMRQEIPPEVTRVLDRTDALISASELNDANQHHKIYICNSYRLARYLLLRNVHFGANLPTGATYITNADVQRDIAECEKMGENDSRRRTLSETIAHEVTHALIRDHLGVWAERRLPVWVKEGYCELVAEGSAIDQRTAISLLKSAWPVEVPGLANFRYRLMVEYLIRDQHMTFDQIVYEAPDYEQVNAEVLASLREDHEAFLRRLGWKERDQPSAIRDDER
ncbi:MAG: hypothetical protein ACYS0G_00405 [Planctomycetota bacterium]